MRRAIFLMLFLSLLQGALSYAALGGAASSFASKPPAQGAGMPAASDSKAGAIYTVSQSKLDSGTVLREYCDEQGQVFAVSWNGPALPDLPALLSGHFQGSRAGAQQQSPAGTAPALMARPDLVIVSNGHPHAYKGRAWLPTALPSGFSADDIE